MNMEELLDNFYSEKLNSSCSGGDVRRIQKESGKLILSLLKDLGLSKTAESYNKVFRCILINDLKSC